jgi:hypothetical protein
MSNEHIEQAQARESLKIASGALVGLAVVALVQMLSLNGLDLPLGVSVFSFAISIPLLSAAFISAIVETSFDYSVDKPFLLKAVMLSGYLASLIGVSALFFHFAIYAGVIFIAGSVIGFLAVTLYDNKLRALEGTNLENP